MEKFRMSLWRKFNDVEDLIGIVKLMDFLIEVRVSTYANPFSHKKYPVEVQSFEDYVKTLDVNNGGEWMTNRISSWVYSNCPYNARGGNYNTQFALARQAYYYYKRRDDFVEKIS